jgi:hypothetical protein
MNVRQLGVGLVAAAILAVPSTSRAIAQHHSATFSHIRQPVATAFACDRDSFRTSGGFARWTPNHGGKEMFTFGSAGSFDGAVGLRIDASGLERSLQFDWNVTDASNPEFSTIINTSSGIQIWNFLQIFETTKAHLLQSFASAQQLSNGYWRFLLTAASDEPPAGATWRTIYLLEQPEVSGFKDSITNVFVNGVPVLPNTHSPIQQDCDFDTP